MNAPTCRASILAQGLVLGLLLPAAAWAQPRPEDVHEQPKPAEIAARVKKILDAKPEETLEVPGVARLVYKRVPLDVHALALEFGGTLTGREQPRGIPLDRYVRQFENHVQQALDAYLAEVGTLEVLTPLTVKKKALPAAKLRCGVVMQNGRPGGFVLQGEELPKGKPVLVKLKKHKTDDPPEADGTLRLRLVIPDPQPEGEERFDLHLRLTGLELVTNGPFQRVAGEGGDEPGKGGDADEE